MLTGRATSVRIKYVTSLISSVHNRIAGHASASTQKILTTAYTNFNTFGLCLTLALGSLIIIVSYILEPLLSCIQKRWRFLDKYSRLEWCANETLQPQRLAHEELGLGTWHRGAEPVPLVNAGDRLAMLNLEDLEHPRLKPPPQGLDEVLAEEVDKKRVQEEAGEPQTCHASNADLLPSPSSGSAIMEGDMRDV